MCYGSYTFVHQSTTENNNKTISPITKLNICNHDNKMMFRSAELRVHRDTMHAGEKKYKCKDCGKLFSQKGSLNRHMAQVNHLTR